MGKGTIISGGSGGLYQVQINYNRTRYEAQIARFVALRASLVSAAAVETDSRKKALIELQILSVDKASSYLINSMPADEIIAAWCTDLTIDLTGIVGTVEIPGEPTYVQIRPGYDGNAVYNATRDGQVMPTIPQDSAQAYYNLAMLPGWQKWKPLSRYGTITAIIGDTASVDLDAGTSSQQNLVINQTSFLTGVPIDYMDCDVVAFEAGDEVLILFTGQDWATPKIVGFKDNPKPCNIYLVVSYTSYTGDAYCFIWDLNNDIMATGVDDFGDPVSFPCKYDDIQDWFTGRTVKTTNPVTTAGIDVVTVENWYIDSGSLVTIPLPTCGTTGYQTTGTGTYSLLNDPVYSDRIYTWDFYQLTVAGGIVESRKEYTRENPTRAIDSYKLISLTSVSDEIERETYAKYIRVEEIDDEIITQAYCGTTGQWQTEENQDVNLVLEAETPTPLLPLQDLDYKKDLHTYYQSTGINSQVLKGIQDHYVKAKGAYGTKYLVAYAASRTILEVKTYVSPGVWAYAYEYLEAIEPVFVTGDHATDAGLLNPLTQAKHTLISAAALNLKSTTDTIAGATTWAQLGIMDFTNEILE